MTEKKFFIQPTHLHLRDIDDASINNIRYSKTFIEKEIIKSRI